jgi:phage FluMu protein Com
MFNDCVSVYCSGCRRKLGEGNGNQFEFKCSNCKSITKLNVGARLGKISGKIAQIAKDSTATLPNLVWEE